MDERELRQIPLTALLVVMAIILPQFFHWLGLGPTFLPMFLPLIIGGLLLTWKFALFAAVAAPLISWLLTGMPPIYPPVLPVVIAETMLIALTLSLLHVHGRFNYWLAYIIAIVLDRLTLFLLVSLIAPLFGWQHPLFSLALVSSGIPGIILQIVVLPLVMKTIQKRFPQYAQGNR